MKIGTHQLSTHRSSAYNYLKEREKKSDTDWNPISGIRMINHFT